MPIRHRSRHLRATLYNRLTTELTALGWVTAPINFATDPVTLLDYQPDERGEIITTNTVALSLGDVTSDEDEELGASNGGLRSAWYPVFVDVYMVEQALVDAVCDDVRDIFDQQIFPLVNQITGVPLDAAHTLDPVTVEVEEVLGPDRPITGNGSIEQFKRYWRIMRLGVRVYYQD